MRVSIYIDTIVKGLNDYDLKSGSLLFFSLYPIFNRGVFQKMNFKIGLLKVNGLTRKKEPKIECI